MITSAYFVRCPKRCVTKTIVLPSRTSSNLLNSCSSPSASNAELGSSTATNLTLPDLNRMKERDLEVEVNYTSAGKKVRIKFHLRDYALPFTAGYIDGLSQLLELFIQRMCFVAVQVELKCLDERVEAGL